MSGLVSRMQPGAGRRSSPLPYSLNGWDGGFDVLSDDEERVLCRGWRSGGDGTRHAVLVALPVGCPPSASILDRFAHEYGLKTELDGAWAARPLEFTNDDGQPMLVLEDAGGEPLDWLLGAPMDVGRFLRLAVNIAKALARVHGRGIVHKDVKPANILVTRVTGDARFTGFGIASSRRQSCDPTRVLRGTLAYMSPEQTGRMNRSLDSRSDLYALGVTLYQMLTGVLPFSATDPVEWVHCHLARRPPAPNDLVKAIPEVISEIIVKLLAKTPEDRYQTAAGLERDLRRCFTEWEARGSVRAFPLGLRDTPDRLLIPEKLHGRGREVETLLASFDGVARDGASRLALVSGYSGVGKSSIVNELRKQLTPPRDHFFASGKCDQYQRHVPYASLAQAFQSLIRPLLSSSEAGLGKWRDAFHEALGSSAKLMTNLVPELRLIIGEPPPLADLPLQDAQHRFQLVIRRFIRVFAKQESPLVLFLDDLQWLDSATLDLIETLLTKLDVRHLMLIGAYRNNEIHSSDPLTHTIEGIRKAGAIVNEIAIAPLGHKDLGQLIGDSLGCDPADASPLVRLVHDKTGGNPFFAIQFLTILGEEGLVAFDEQTRMWKWDWVGINAKSFTDNLVELMLGRLRRLPSSAQDALKLLACLGNNTDMEMLLRVLGTENATIREDVNLAVDAGLIVRRGEQLRFLHDRVQEAARALMPDNMRPAFHLMVGRRLLAGLTLEGRDEQVFEAVSHLNVAAPTVTDSDERRRIAMLNLQAGTRAKASAAYLSACAFFESGLSFLGDGSQEQHDGLRFSLLLERAECELQGGNFERSGELIGLLFSKARSRTERTEAYRLQVTLQLLRGDMAPAVRTALECLESFGMTFPEVPTKRVVLEEYEDLQRRMGSRSIESLLEIPLMEDPEILALSGVLLTLGESSYFVDEHLYAMLALRMVKLSIEFGHSSSCVVGYGGVGIILGPMFGRYDDGVRFARVAVAVTERSGFLAHRSGAYVLLQMASLWTKTVDEALAHLDAADRSSRESGEIVFACISAEHRVTNMLARGHCLDIVWPEAVERSAFVQRRGYAHIADILLATRGFIASLRGDAASVRLVDDENKLIRTGLAVVKCYYWIFQLQLRFLLGDSDGAIEAAENATPDLWSASCHIQIGTFRFYHTLALLNALRSAPTDAPEARREQVAENFAALGKLADAAPHTYGHKHALATAELAGGEGRDVEAMRLYEQAIRSALDKGFTQDAAVGAELAGDFFARCGLAKVALSYRGEARDLYQRWGAAAKVAQLEMLHPEIAPKVAGWHPAIVETSLKHLDLSTMIEVSQAVSGELDLERLIDKIMRAAIEHAGAERGLLISLRGDEPRIDAEATTNGRDIAVRLMGAGLATAALPDSLIRYVARTRETVILDDARSQIPFSSDAYLVQRGARSVLCIPLINRGELLGVLYLENNLARQVFTPDRVTFLTVLASQASISLQNSGLYHELADREAKIRRLMDANVLGIFFWNPEGRIVEANEAFLRMVRYEPEDIVSGHLRWSELIPAERRELDQRLYADPRTSRAVQPHEMEFLRKDCSRLPVLVGGALFEHDGTQGVAFVLDLTERNRAEKALRESEEALRRSEAYLAEAQSLSHTASIAYNDSSILYWSDETYRIWQFDPSKGLPTREAVLERIHPDDRQRVVEEARRAVAETRDYRLEYRIVLPTDAIKYIEVAAHPKFSANGELVEVVCTLLDVTERTRARNEQRKVRQLEADLAHVNRLSMMGEMAASLAHEITQPIATARNNARAAINFLGKEPPDLGEVKEALGCVVDDSDRAGQIVDRIRDHIKKAPPRNDSFALKEAIDEVIGLARSVLAENCVSARVSHGEGLLAVQGDRVQVQQVVLNLILNAGEAMSTVDERARELSIGAERGKPGEVVVAVCDSGPGIEPERRERVFDAFYTTKSSGVGMGLSICRSIIAAHGGHLWVEGNEPSGAVFRFTLPTAKM